MKYLAALLLLPLLGGLSPDDINPLPGLDYYQVGPIFGNDQKGDTGMLWITRISATEITTVHSENGGKLKQGIYSAKLFQNDSIVPWEIGATRQYFAYSRGDNLGWQAFELRP